MDAPSDRQQRLVVRASTAARAGDMTTFLKACHDADTSAYALLARLQAEQGLIPEERSNLATVAREMDCYRGKHGHLPHEQGADRSRRPWYRFR